MARTRPEDVVLSAGDRPGRWKLRIDPTHPVLFDHPVDHAPGMLLLEAARQAAHAASGRPSAVVGMKAEFLRYTEFDSPCWVWADRLPSDPQGRRRVLTTLEQNGRRVFSADVTLEAAPGLVRPKTQRPRSDNCPSWAFSEPLSGFEPETYALRVRCSGHLS